MWLTRSLLQPWWSDGLEAGSTGGLVALNDEAGFVEACKALLHDCNGLRHMGEKNLRRVAEFFIDRCAASYEQVYERVLDGSA